jgi:ACS family hexuronate transporter-like MFS transporter
MTTAATKPAEMWGTMPFRWVVAALLVLASILNYIDRQSLSILATTIQKDLGIGDRGYAAVVQCFLLFYTVMYLVSGRIVDWLGTRVSETLFILWWAISNMCTSLTGGVVSLAVVRSSLGIGEPGNFTAAAKAVSEWFPAREKGIAVGLYSMGGTIGAAIAAPLVSFLAIRYGWRSAFVATGSLGVLLSAVWFAVYRRPEGMPGIAGQRPAPWSELVSSRALWLILVSRMITDPLWYFYLFWFPKYLQDSRGFTLAQVGKTVWIIFVAADCGCLLGGWLSGRFIRNGVNPVAARLRVMCGAAALLVFSFAMPLLAGTAFPIGAASLFAMAHMAWMTNSTTLPIDIFPSRKIGSVQGAVGAGSSLGGFLSAGLIGLVITRSSYAPLFVGMSALHPAALGILLWWLPRRREADGEA